MQFRILDYFLVLSEGPYEEQASRDKEWAGTIRDKKWAKMIFNHIKRCDICREGHEYLKNVFETINQNTKDGFFSLDEFKMIKRNEKHLEEVV